MAQKYPDRSTVASLEPERARSLTTPRAVEQRIRPSDLAELLEVGAAEVNRIARRFGGLKSVKNWETKRRETWITPAGAVRVIISVRAEQGRLVMADPRSLSAAERLRRRRLLPEG